jgi:hypothetical protein
MSMAPRWMRRLAVLGLCAMAGGGVADGARAATLIGDEVTAVHNIVFLPTIAIAVPLGIHVVSAADENICLRQFQPSGPNVYCIDIGADTIRVDFLLDVEWVGRTPHIDFIGPRIHDLDFSGGAPITGFELTTNIALYDEFTLGNPLPAFFPDEEGTASFNIVGLTTHPGDFIEVRLLTAIAEPGTLALVGAGALGLFVARRRKRADVRL